MPSPDLELPPRSNATPPISRLRIELKKPVLKACTAPLASPQASSPPSKAEPHNVLHVGKEPEDGVTWAVLACDEVLPEMSAVTGTDTVPAETAENLGPLVTEVKSENSEAVEGPASKVESLAVADPAVLRDEGEAKQPVIEEREGGVLPKMSEPPSHKEAEGVGVESEVSKGKKRKKRARLVTADGAMDSMGNKLRKGDRYCYMCGSPEHIARDCLNCVGQYPAHPGPYGTGVPLPPAGMPPPYAPDLYWHGPPLPHSGRPYLMNYVEGMFGPGPGMIPFERPMMPGGPYCMPPYLPPVYRGGPRHEGFLGPGVPRLMHPMERPLSREEFIELQERERLRRIMQDYDGRNWSPERLHPRVASRPLETGDWDCNMQQYADRRVIARDGQAKHTGFYPDESDDKRRKGSKQERVGAVERLVSSGEARHSSSDDEYAPQDDDDQDLRRSPVKKRRQWGAKAGPVETLKDGKRPKQDTTLDKESSDFDDDEYAEPAHPVRHHGRERSKDAETPPSKHNKRVHSKDTDDEGSWQDGLATDGDGQSFKHRGRRITSEGGSHGEELADLGKKREVRSVGPGKKYASDELDEFDEDSGRSRSKKHRSHTKPKATMESHYEYGWEEDERRKRKKHQKRGGSSSEHRRDKVVVVDFDSGAEVSGKHRRHRKSSKDESHHHHTARSSPPPTKRARWDLESSERGQLDQSEQKHHRHRNSRPEHSRLEHDWS